MTLSKLAWTLAREATSRAASASYRVLAATKSASKPAILAESALLAVADNAVVLKAYRNFGPLRQALDELELGDKAVFVSRLGMEDECVVFGLEHAPDAPHYLSLVLVRKTAG